MSKKITDLLDFSDWTLWDIRQVKILDDKELAEMEHILTNASGEMSQIDHVGMVVTYKAKLAENGG